jgi:hypothetical protein
VGQLMPVRHMLHPCGREFRVARYPSSVQGGRSGCNHVRR